MTKQSTLTRTKWGSAKIGGRRIPALAIAIPAGLVIALGIAVVVQLAGGMNSDPLIGIPVVALALSPATMGAVYVFVVDRESIRGAVARPEESIESGWFEKAAAGSFTDILFVAGIGAAVAAFTRWEAEVSLVLGGLLIVAFASFGIRYLLMKGRA